MSIVSSIDKEEFFLASEGCYVTELCNSEADFAVSIARIRVRPGDTTNWHRLKNTVERYYIVSGCGLVEVGDAPARTVLPGDVVIISAMERQRISNEGEVDLVFLAICSPRFEEKNFLLAE
ncbi:MAG: cupin domain-containing protein [Granulosicoccus sp.]